MSWCPTVRIDFWLQGFQPGLSVLAIGEPEEAHLVLIGREQDVKTVRLRRTWTNISVDLAEEFMFLAKARVSIMDIMRCGSCNLRIAVFALGGTIEDGGACVASDAGARVLLENFWASRAKRLRLQILCCGIAVASVRLAAIQVSDMRMSRGSKIGALTSRRFCTGRCSTLRPRRTHREMVSAW